MTTAPGVTAPARPLPPAPPRTTMSDVWRTADGTLVQGEPGVQLPIDPNTKRVIGTLFACPDGECTFGSWAIEPATDPAVPFCGTHGSRLVKVPLIAEQADPVAAGRGTQLQRIAAVYAHRREVAAAQLRAAAAAKIDAAGSTVTGALDRMRADMRGHIPSLAASTSIAAGAVFTVDLAGPLGAAAVAASLGTGGALVCYALALIAQRIRLRRRAERFEGRAAKKARANARWAGFAVLASGVYLAAMAAVDVDLREPLPDTLLAVGLAAGLSWWVNKGHWDELWAARRRLRQMEADRLRAEAEREAQRLLDEAERLRREAEEAARLAAMGEYDENDPLHQGRRMAAEWERIAGLDSAPAGFPQIGATRIVPEQTREITAPDDTGSLVRIGWEFIGVSSPGALVSRGGAHPPIMEAKPWLTAVLDDGRYDSSMLTLVDQPGKRANTFMLMITEQARLGEPVVWKGKAGIRREGGKIFAHRGRSLLGEDVEELLYDPGQPFGGADIGTTGGGKTAGTILYILNCLAAGIFPILFDPKNLTDYAAFIGIFPIGVTPEHREIILRSQRAERRRREKMMGKRKIIDPVTGWEVEADAVWDLAYGPPLVGIWEEFHDVAKDEGFSARLTTHIRYQRSSGNGAKLITQGGGLADFQNSMLRQLLTKTALTTYRSDDMQARMAGNRNQSYSAADLPQLAGMQLFQAPGAPATPLRGAYIPREPGVPGNLTYTLWGQGKEKVFQFTDPMSLLSPETIALWEKTGLMALWRQAQGPGGLDRLLDDVDDDEDGDEALAGPAGAPEQTGPVPGRMLAEDIILAIVRDSPACDRQTVYAHPAWQQAPGWAKPADPATISRAARKLDPLRDNQGRFVDKAGNVLRDAVQLLSRAEDGREWLVLEAGHERADRALAALKASGSTAVAVTSAPGTAAGGTQRMSAPQIETREQIAAETAAIAAADARMAGSWT